MKKCFIVLVPEAVGHILCLARENQFDLSSFWPFLQVSYLFLWHEVYICSMVKISDNNCFDFTSMASSWALLLNILALSSSWSSSLECLSCAILASAFVISSLTLSEFESFKVRSLFSRTISTLLERVRRSDDAFKVVNLRLKAWCFQA